MKVEKEKKSTIKFGISFRSKNKFDDYKTSLGFTSLVSIGQKGVRRSKFVVPAKFNTLYYQSGEFPEIEEFLSNLDLFCQDLNIENEIRRVMKYYDASLGCVILIENTEFQNFYVSYVVGEFISRFKIDLEFIFI